MPLRNSQLPKSNKQRPLAFYLILNLILFIDQSMPILASETSQKRIKLNRKVENYELIGENNKSILIPGIDQRYKIIYFGFTSCPDVCPMTLQKLSSLLKKHHLSESVSVYFIDLDWKNDTGDKASLYASHFGTQFYGVSGKRLQIEKITSYYKVYFSYKELPDSAMKYTIDHSSYLYLLSPENKLLNVTNSSGPEGIIKYIQKPN